jgi:serine/threonine protein kinase
VNPFRTGTWSSADPDLYTIEAMSGSTGVADLQLADPRTIGVYRLLGRLGSGSQGVVYLAEAPSGARVAIKRLLSSGEDNHQDRQQLAKEVAAARLVAPFCTAQLLDVRLEGPSPYVVSEYISGPTLSRKVSQDGPITGSALQRLAIGTVTALAAIHQAGVVHRDFKPANVMLSPDGHRVIDFGIARDLATEMTETSRIIGTPAYMSPEQLRDEPVEPATDMFAWASVIAFAATGRSLFAGDHLMAVAYQILSGEPVLDGVPDELRPVLERCLAKEPARRPTAEQTLGLLLGRPEPEAGPDLLMRGSRIAEDLTPVPAAPPVRSRGMSRARRTALFGLLVCVLVVGGWAVGHSGKSGQSAGSLPLVADRESPRTSARPAGLPAETVSRAAVSTATPSADQPKAKKKPSQPRTASKPAATPKSTPAPTPKQALSATGTGAIAGPDGKCLDIINARSDNGTRVQIFACNGSKAQVWRAKKNGTIQALGKCLNVAGGAIEINACDGTGDQTWRIASDVIVNVGSGRCLDTEGGDSADRTLVVVAGCSGADSQAWALQA